MTLPAQVQAPLHPTRSAWGLRRFGSSVAVSGGIWWAFDADPGWGKTLVLVGLGVAVVGYLLTRRPGALPTRALTFAAALLVLLAGYEIWQALSAIFAQGAAHTA